MIPLLIVLGLAFLLFSRPGRISSLMEDLGKGISGFRKGLTDAETPPAAEEPPPPSAATDTNEDRAQN